MAQVTARNAAIATVSFENFILFQQKGIASLSILMASMESLAILKALPGNGTLTLWVHLFFPLALCRLHLRRKPSERRLKMVMFEPHFGHLNEGYFLTLVGLYGAN